MKADKSDDLQNIPSFSVSQDDIRTQPAKSPKTAKKSTGQSTVKANKSGSLMMPMLSLLLFAALSGVSYFGYQQAEALKAELASNQQAFELTLQRLQDVNGKVVATGASMNEAGSKVQAELKVLNSEIRKLWDIANKRNKHDIAGNEAQLEKLSKKFAGIDKRLAATEKQAKAGTADVAKATKRVDELKSQVQMSGTEQAAQLEGAMENIDGVQAALLALSAKMELQLNQQREELDDVAATTSINGDAVTSIDAFRRQVNSQLLELKQAINRLQGGRASIGTTTPAAG